MSAEQPISHATLLRTDRYDQTPGELKGVLHHVPLRTQEGNLVIMQAFNHEVASSEVPQTLPRWTVVLMGGGASGAIENIGMIKRTADAAQAFEISQPDKSKFRVSNVLSISHPQGTAREQKIVDTKDFTQSAQLIVDTLLHTQVGVDKSAGFVLWGFSAGGGVLIEVARLLQKKGKAYKLVIADPAATSEHVHFTRKVTVDTNVDIFRHFYLLLEKIPADKRPLFSGVTKWFQILKDGKEELLNSMTTPDGAPTISELILEMIYAGQKRLNSLAQRFGLPKSTGGVMPDATLLENDVTAAARQEIRGQVILVSSVFAKVVNLLVARGDISDHTLNALWKFFNHKSMGNKLEVYKKLHKQYPQLAKNELVALVHELTGEGYIQQAYDSIAQSLFPNATVQTLPVLTGLHSGMMRLPNIHRTIIGKLHQV